MSPFSLRPSVPLRPLSRPGRLWAVVLALACFASLLLVVLPARADDAEARPAESPYFFVRSDDPGTDRLPLKATEVEARIAGAIADVTVTQRYRNEGQRPIEARYVFPGSTRAAVHAMQVRIGDRLIVADIREKQRARVEFEAAKREGRTAALLEQERPNVFSMNVANILPGDEVAVELRYTELLPPSEGRYQFVYPTVVGPRYHRPKAEGGTTSFPAVPYLREGEASTAAFDLRVAFASPLPVSGLRSSSHQVEVEGDGTTGARVALGGEAAARRFDGNRDFVLDWQLAGERLSSGLTLFPGRPGEENFFLAMVEPPRAIPTTQIVPREYVFVVDISGSMHGYPLDTAKTLLRHLIGGLRPSDTFNVLLFSGSNRVLNERSVPATQANVDQALRVIAQMGGSGSTEIVPALKRVAALPKAPEISRTVVVVTDGYVTVENEVFDLVRRHLDQANVFAFGIGSSVNRHLIEGIARAGQGEPFIVTKPEQAAAQAERLRRMIESPVLTQVKARFEGLDVYDVEPQPLPDVLGGRPVLLFGKWRGEPRGQLVVEGQAANGAWSTLLPVPAPDADAAALRHLWARHRIQSLSDQEALQGGDAQRDAITALGLRYHLLTQYTSFIAVDRIVRTAPGGTATPVDQPSPLPQGVSERAVGSLGAEVPSTPEASGWLALAVVGVLLAGAAWHRGGSSARPLWRRPRRLRSLPR